MWENSSNKPREAVTSGSNTETQWKVLKDGGEYIYREIGINCAIVEVVFNHVRTLLGQLVQSLDRCILIALCQKQRQCCNIFCCWSLNNLKVQSSLFPHQRHDLSFLCPASECSCTVLLCKQECVSGVSNSIYFMGHIQYRTI